jgi:hypothetical protein
MTWKKNDVENEVNDPSLDHGVNHDVLPWLELQTSTLWPSPIQTMTTWKKSKTTRRIDIADPYHSHAEVQVLEVAVVVGGTVTKRRTGVGCPFHSRAEVQGLVASVE